ncbi:MAG: DUF362 domain-containing protein [Polyangia bacterium]
MQRRSVLALVLCATAALREGGGDADPPAPAQPDAVSRASSTEWSAGQGSPPAVQSALSFDGARARERVRKRLKADSSPVTVLRGDSPLALGQHLCEQVVPRRPPETPVLLKPNLGGFDWFKPVKEPGGDDGVRGRVTQPEFVRGVIRCLKARGHSRITIADGWDSPHAAWQRLIKISGYEQLAREEGVRLVALDDDGIFDRTEPGQPAQPVRVTGMERTQVPTLLLPKLVTEHLERGLFLSLPKLKAHRFAVVSIAVKGMQGVVMMSDAAPAHRQKWRMHREVNKYLKARKQGLPEKPGERAEYVAALTAFAERITDVLEVAAPDAVLVDGAPAMGGDGFQKLWPSTERFALGGTNPLTVDRVGAELLGLWDSAALANELGGHRTSPLITTAARRFGVDLGRPAVVGDGAQLVPERRPVHYVAMAPFALHEEPGAAPAGPTAPTADAGGASGGGAGAPVAEPPIAHAAPLGALKVTIDGKGDDLAWSRAVPVRWDTDYAGSATGLRTTARFLWAPGTLYALWEVEGTGLNVDARFPPERERKDLYTEDCVELMLAPEVPGRFFEIELGPRGHFFDLIVDRKARPSENTAWSSGLRIATAADPPRRSAVIEVALGAPEIAELLKPGARLALGLFRMEGKAPRRYLAWRPTRTPKPNFHLPEAFGRLVVDP